MNRDEDVNHNGNLSELIKIVEKCGSRIEESCPERFKSQFAFDYLCHTLFFHVITIFLYYSHLFRY